MKAVSFVFNAAAQQEWSFDEDLILLGVASFLEFCLVSTDAGLTMAEFTDNSHTYVRDDSFSFLLYNPAGSAPILSSLLNLSYPLLAGQKIFVTTASGGLVTAFFTLALFS